ncbi:3862_t:CDS:1, partial [Rhizophagus irregularis]
RQCKNRNELSAPEITRACENETEIKADFATDMFSFGLVLYLPS